MKQIIMRVLLHMVVVFAFACGNRENSPALPRVDGSQLMLISKDPNAVNVVKDLMMAYRIADVSWMSMPPASSRFIAIIRIDETIFEDVKSDLGKVDGLKIFPILYYEGERRDAIQESSKTNHHDIVGSHQAWVLSKGDGVVVALTDDGFDYRHEGLIGQIWSNKGEVGIDANGNDKSANGLDDDSNGYVDDIRGWDMGRNDNDPKPEYFFHQHGTFIAGLIAGNRSTNIGVDGIAPNSRIMPIKYRVGPRWTSADIFRGYKYAVDNGAKIINTSYDLDLYANDEVFKEAIRYAYDRNVLVVNSAGNQGIEDSPRQMLDGLIIVCGIGTEENPLKIYPKSNFGHGIDICAPAAAHSTVPNNKYSSLEGTSFASAMVAGVAALVWSLHPDYSVDQVMSVILGSAKDVISSNPGFDGKMGSGSVDAHAAVKGYARNPQVYRVDADIVEDRTRIRLWINGVLSAASLANANFHAYRISDPTDIITLSPSIYRAGANFVSFESEFKMKPGLYRIRVDGVLDPFGRGLLGLESDFPNDIVEISFEIQ